MDKISTGAVFYIQCVHSASVSSVTVTVPAVTVSGTTPALQDFVTGDYPDADFTEFWVWMVALVLAGVALVSGAIYMYIYYAKIRPIPRSQPQASTGSHGRGSRFHGNVGAPSTKPDNQPGQITVKRSPFYLVGKMIYMSPGSHSKQNPLAPNRR